MSAPVYPSVSTTALAPVTLVLGGMHSGKSRHAEALIEGQPGACIYVATAEAGDAEMAERIRRHRPIATCSALQARPRRYFWPDIWPCKRLSGQPWSDPCPKRRRRRAVPRRHRCLR